METLPDTFIHPAGYCQNVLATGRTWVGGTDVVGVAGRSAILIECDHPRTIEMAADRPDFHIQVAVDRLDGVILRLVESMGGSVTRHAEAVDYAPDASIPATAFEFEFPRHDDDVLGGIQPAAATASGWRGWPPMILTSTVEPMIVITTAPRIAE